MKRTMATTTDNPFDYFKDFHNWYSFDESKGYHTCALLARLTITSDELNEEIVQKDIEEAVDMIVSMNPTKNYIKIETID